MNRKGRQIYNIDCFSIPARILLLKNVISTSFSWTRYVVGEIRNGLPSRAVYGNKARIYSNLKLCAPRNRRYALQIDFDSDQVLANMGCIVCLD